MLNKLEADRAPSTKQLIFLENDLIPLDLENFAYKIDPQSQQLQHQRGADF